MNVAAESEATTRQAYERREITELKWIRRERNPEINYHSKAIYQQEMRIHRQEMKEVRKQEIMQDLKREMEDTCRSETKLPRHELKRAYRR